MITVKVALFILPYFIPFFIVSMVTAVACQLMEGLGLILTVFGVSMFLTFTRARFRDHAIAIVAIMASASHPNVIPWEDGHPFYKGVIQVTLLSYFLGRVIANVARAGPWRRKPLS